MTHHKLIHAASERVLNDAKTILEENIQDQGRGPSGQWREHGAAGGGGARGKGARGIQVCVPGWGRAGKLGQPKGFYSSVVKTKCALWAVCGKQHKPKLDTQHPSEKPDVSFIFNSASARPGPPELPQGLQSAVTAVVSDGLGRHSDSVHVHLPATVSVWSAGERRWVFHLSSKG